mmetsp:Transcript_6240/g.12336  ORF Transcript_6240/g.12336 Transcript_6240/m.12336 type:complete len:242 (+) Transcript_6240:2923-3648(+)
MSSEREEGLAPNINAAVDAADCNPNPATNDELSPGSREPSGLAKVNDKAEPLGMNDATVAPKTKSDRDAPPEEDFAKIDVLPAPAFSEDSRFSAKLELGKETIMIGSVVAFISLPVSERWFESALSILKPRLVTPLDAFRPDPSLAPTSEGSAVEEFATPSPLTSTSLPDPRAGTPLTHLESGGSKGAAFALRPEAKGVVPVSLDVVSLEIKTLSSWFALVDVFWLAKRGEDAPGSDRDEG